jgi:hypothetical protein
MAFSSLRSAANELGQKSLQKVPAARCLANLSQLSILRRQKQNYLFA